MDKCIVAVEDSHRRSDSLASPSKSLGSLVQINSIAIDITCAMAEIEPPTHEHFSIRGFVAGMREKDWKTCVPFGFEGDDDAVGDDLPPLSIPRFRWWQCSTCVPDSVPDICTERTTLEMPPADQSDIGISSCHNMDGEKDGLSSHTIQRTGDEHRLRDSEFTEDDDISNKMMVYSPSCTEGPKATTCSREKIDFRENEGENSCACATESDTFQITEKRHDTADASDMAFVVENPSTRVDEQDNASSGSEGALSELQHKRKPKLRSLADIMEEEKNSTSEHPRARSTSSSGMQVKSTEAEADLDPQLLSNVPADIAKGTRSPQRKKKIVPEDDRGHVEMTYPIGAAKRLKGPIPDAEKTWRRIEIPDSESEGDAAIQLNLRQNVKTQQIKTKKNKSLDTCRKIRQAHIDNRTIPMRKVPEVKAVPSADLHKHITAAETSFGNTQHIHSTLDREMEPYFTSVLSGQQMDRISNLSKGNGPEAELCPSPYMPPSKRILDDCNIQGDVALDLSLSSSMGAQRSSHNQVSFRQPRSIPDLNESFAEKMSITQGKHLPTPSEKRSLTLNRNLEMSASCSKEAPREGKRKLGVSQPQTVHNMDNNAEPGGALDDIPMEIVELMAKNQRERELGNSRLHLLPEGINNAIRGSPTVYVDGRPGMINFPFSNSSSASIARGKMGSNQGILNFPQVKNCRFDIGNPEESQFRLFTSLTPSQQKKTRYSASSSVVSGLRPSEGSDLLWPPRGKNLPFHLSVTQNHSIPPNALTVHSFSDHSVKGKTISSIKGNEKKTMQDASVVQQCRIASNPKAVGSLDTYSNDTIPAMQLLSLMDRGIVSGSSFKVGQNSFLDKPFSPCHHHPRRNGNENQNDSFLNASLFSQNSHPKKFPGLLNGVCFPGESLKKPCLQGRIPLELGNSKAAQFEGPSNSVIRSSRGNLALGACTLNQNPADFSIPDARNEFTISAKDLKSRKRNALKERSHFANVAGQKRQRVRKDVSRKECSRK